ncbi:MAG: AbrB/MazE/SpoVT family DNA-binding domain-containing protein [Candidatus Thermoplasmatota archaeon]|nr:AbrB/MazE/SpoVT family DNA-binding domain-containing protein [Candidatus Thermoplasmatota archaeon]
MTEAEVRKVGKRGQVTIPKSMREKEDIEGGDKVEVLEKDGKIIIKQIDRTEELKEAYQEMAKQSEEISEEMLTASKEALDLQ